MPPTPSARWLAGLAALALTATPYAAWAADAQFTLRLSSWGSPTAPQVSVFVPAFKAAVEGGSGGRIAVQAFPAGALVKEQDVPSAIQSRVVDISLSTIGGWSSISPPAALINSVMFRPTKENFLKLAGSGSPLFKALDESLAKRKVHLLAVLDNGPPMLVSRFSVQKPGDIKGKPIRAYDKASSQIIQTFGGAPSTMSVSEVYSALQHGVVQGAIGGIQGAIGLKEYEVAKYMLNGNGVWGVGVTIYVMNGAALSGLARRPAKGGVRRRPHRRAEDQRGDFRLHRQKREGDGEPWHDGDRVAARHRAVQGLRRCPNAAGQDPAAGAACRPAEAGDGCQIGALPSPPR